MAAVGTILRRPFSICYLLNSILLEAAIILSCHFQFGKSRANPKEDMVFQNQISNRKHLCKHKHTEWSGKEKTHTVDDIVAMLVIGHTLANRLANAELFKAICIGNTIHIFRNSFEVWLKMDGLDNKTE